MLIFHGYLLSGTGSNVYNARLAEALVAMGHHVHLLCQERHPEEHRFVEAWGDWDEGELRMREPNGSAAGARCTLYRPDIGGLLPVYVADSYEGVTALPFSQCSEEQVRHYVQANVAAVRELCERVEPHAALANHLVMGPVILARGLQGRVPYAVKVHGSALEYTVKPEPDRFLPFAREGLQAAAGVLVGSRHTAESLWRALDQPWLQPRTRLGPPGVDVARFAPRDAAHARTHVRDLAARLRADAQSGSPERAGVVPRGTVSAGIVPGRTVSAGVVPRGTVPAGAAPVGVVPGEVADGTASGAAGAPAASAFARQEGEAAAALERLAPRDRIVTFVGKLIVSKGVDLLIAAFPLVLEQLPDARLLLVGFGAYRGGCEALIAALAAGELPAAMDIALAGRSLEDTSAPPRPLGHLVAFLRSLQAEERERYLRSAASMAERVLLTGRLEHEELAEVLPACEALVVPSTFPEAFGMVAAEAAACGVLPVSAAHSGLAEVSRALATAVPAQAAPWLSFSVDDDSVRAIAACLLGWLGAKGELRERTREGLVASARQRWSWEGVARGVLAASAGELDSLALP